MKKEYKAVVTALEAHGYRYDRTNSSQRRIYVRAGSPEISVGTNIDDRTARALIANLERAAGTAPKPNKRNPAEIRRRQAKRRDELRAEIAREKAALHAARVRRAQRLDGVGDLVTEAELSQIAALIEKRERELRHIEGLMSQGPLNNRARHRS